MGKFNKKWFEQIMINKVLKRELDNLKKIIAVKPNVKYNLSYGDVITILVDHYKKNITEYPVEQKLQVSIPLKHVRPLSVSSKLDEKIRVSYSVES